MKIVLFGEDIFTATVFQSLIDNNHQVLMVICPFYKNSNHLKLEYLANNKNINFTRYKNINSMDIRDKLIEVKPDLLISVHLRKILNKDIFEIPILGAINVHPSLLPKYRGLSPQHQAIIHGDLESGVTVHYIDKDIDTGNVIIQSPISIKLQDYISDFQLKMLKVYQSIVISAIELISNTEFSPIAQTRSDASYYNSISLKDREINFLKTKTEALNLIRAVSFPYKGAYTNNITIWRAEVPAYNIEDEAILDYKKIGTQIINEDLLILRFNDGILTSNDFEIQ